MVNGRPQLVDLGTGVVRPAAAQKGVLGLDTVALRIGFITHLSDQTLGLADVMLTPWIMGEKSRLPSSESGRDQARTDECRQAGSEGQLLKQVRQAYKGNVVAGHNLEID
jgi:hypothetical protein